MRLIQCLLAIALGLVLVAPLMPNAASVTTYTATISLQGLPANLATNVFLDGSPNGTLNGGQSRSFAFQTSLVTHWITVDFYVPSSIGEAGVRYSNPDTSWVFTAGGSHVFTYTAQYYLNVTSSVGAATGAGWYDSGAKAQATLSNAEVDLGPGARLEFVGWGGDASGTALTSNQIVVDKPKTAVANWKTQFLLEVTSDPPNVTGILGSGWYDSGAQASFSAPSFSQANSNSRLRFDHWSGGYSGQSASGSISMSQPQFVQAHFVAQYLLTINYDPLSMPQIINQTSWHDANTNVELGPVQPIVSVSSLQRLRFVAWIESGKQLTGLSVNLNMDHPQQLTLSYMTQYYVDVRSSYGPVTGSGWYDRGAVAKITAPTTAGVWPFTYTLQNWNVDPPSKNASVTNGSLTLTVDGPYTVDAVWSFNVLPLFVIIIGVMLVIVVAVAMTIAYRRGMLTRPMTTLHPQVAKVPTRGPNTTCPSCGSPVAKGAVFCQKCGTSLLPVEHPPLEDKVYDYIVKREGVISLSQAAKDLGISVSELERTTESLKKKGRLA